MRRTAMGGSIVRAASGLARIPHAKLPAVWGNSYGRCPRAL